MWYHRVIGRERCPIVDTWWQTETGSIMMTPVPGVTPTKPGSCTKPLPGIFVDIVDDEGRPVTKAGAGGYLVIKRPWPSMLSTIWGDNERYLNTYWEKFQNRYYVAGDSAHRDADGYYWIMGRIDDVLNVAGHRLGTMELESALVAHPRVAEAAVVGKPHEIKGESVFAYVVLNVERPVGAAASALTEELRAWVGEQLSPIAKPDEIRLTDNLPKTRSGKIMRRLLRSLARGEEITQDVSTLENPAILDQLRGVPAAASGSPKQAAVNKRAVPGARAAAPVTQAMPKKGTAQVKRTVTTKRRKPVQRAGGKRVMPAKKANKATRRQAPTRRDAPAKWGPTKRAKTAKRAKPSMSAKRAKRAKQAKRKVTAARLGKTRSVAISGGRKRAAKAVRRKPRRKK